MTLSKYDLISPSSYNMAGVGHVKAIRLCDIDALPDKYETYTLYTTILNCDGDALFEMLGADKIEGLSVFDILVSNETLLGQTFLVLDFFFDEDIAYIRDQKKFILSKMDNIVGEIDRDNFAEVASVILQRCAISSGEKENKPIFKNARAKQVWEKMYAKGAETPKDFADRKKYDIGNIISHLASRGSGLNILNIWNMTIYNVYDQFMILRTAEAHNISSMSVAVWGDKDKKFDVDSWF